VSITTAGGQEVLNARAESALTEAGWFVEATASTTAHMLGGVLVPHDVVQVEGLGPVDSGPYQVKSVTHVIKATEHLMDLELRRNAIGVG
jgi:1-aminocyclopropane-1-carboxylate deaminase/D-cysteine desulfhydrase-like pyridoxal-dependent ACC family enzyme